MNKIALTIPADHSYDEIYELTCENKTKYCQKYGYDLLRFIGIDAPAKEIPWDKIQWLHDKILSKYEYVLLQGVDTLIMNYNIRIEDWIDPQYDWVISRDCHDVNADMILMKNSKWSLDYLDFIYSQYEKYRHDCWNEQRCIIDTYKEHADHIKVIPQQSFNSYWYPYYDREEDHDGNFKEGDWILHFPGMKNELRLIEIQKWMDKVIC
jgi:hypothetical protein